jgi:polysaccharide biosynthesis/export protein
MVCSAVMIYFVVATTGCLTPGAGRASPGPDEQYAAPENPAQRDSEMNVTSSASSVETQPAISEIDPFTTSLLRTSVPTIRPGMNLNIEVWVAGRKEISEAGKRVNPEGAILLPIVGSLRAEGLTLTSFNQLVLQRYSDYFVDPQVLVEYARGDEGAASPWGSVTVLGRVGKPGRVNIPPTQDLRVSTAIQLAGGLASSARETAIRVSRVDASGETQHYTLDLRAIGRSGNAELDLILLPGDFIYVPEAVF